MGASLDFFAGPQDERELCEYAASIGLVLVPHQWEGEARPEIKTGELGDRRLYYLSPVPVAQLHPYGGPSVFKVSWATDPLIEFIRSVSRPPQLMAGRLWWSQSPVQLAAVSKPYLGKLKRWMAKRWVKREDGFFVGTEAAELERSGGIVLGGLVPPDQIRTVDV